MHWAIYCRDSPDAGERRHDVLPAHITYLASAPVRVLLGGPLAADDQEPRSGSLLIVQASERVAVEDFIRAAPFSTSGVWAQIQINVFTPVGRNVLADGAA